MTTRSDVLWVMQTNLLGAAHTASESKLASFLEMLGVPFRGLELVPFDDSPIHIEWDGPVVFRGSTKLVERVATHGGYTPGVWYDRQRASFEALKAGYGDWLLNAASEVLTLGELLDRTQPRVHFSRDARLFIRPTDDMKVFVGGVRTIAELPELLTSGSKSRATRDTQVQVAAPRTITREWRTFVVAGKVIAGSQYRAYGRAVQHGDYGTLPKAIATYAEEAAQLYQPEPVFVMDIGELEDSTLRIVECNCFNCSGLYWSDCYNIALAVSEYAAQHA